MPIQARVDTQVNEEKETKMTAQALPLVKQMVRRISKVNRTDSEAGVDSIFDVDMELSAWVEQGYDITSHLLSDEPESMNVYYFMIKR